MAAGRKGGGAIKPPPSNVPYILMYRTVDLKKGVLSMYLEVLPGIFRHDEFFGIVTSTNRSGAFIHLKSGDGQELPAAYSFCNASVGDHVLISVRRFDPDRETLLVNVDSIFTEVGFKRAAAA